MWQVQFQGLLLLLIFTRLLYLKKTLSTVYYLEACPYVMKHSVLNRPRKETPEESYCVKPQLWKCSYVSASFFSFCFCKLESCSLMYSLCNAAGSDISACGQHLDLHPTHCPQFTSTAVILSTVHKIQNFGPNTGTMAS